MPSNSPGIIKASFIYSFILKDLSCFVYIYVLCMYVFVWVSRYVYVCVYECVHIYVFVCMYVFVCVCVDVCLCMCFYECIHLCVCLCFCLYMCCLCVTICVCMCLCICECVCIFVCMWVYVCKCICVYICLGVCTEARKVHQNGWSWSCRYLWAARFVGVLFPFPFSMYLLPERCLVSGALSWSHASVGACDPRRFLSSFPFTPVAISLLYVLSPSPEPLP